MPMPFVDDLETARADIEAAESAAPKAAGRIASTAGTALGFMALGGPQLVQSGMRLARAAGGNLGTLRDMGRLALGNPRPIIRRIGGLLAEASEAGAKAPPPPAAALEPATVVPTEPAIETALRAPASSGGTRVTQEEARNALAKLLQKNVEEGAAEHAASLHKGVPTPDVPTNWDLMQRMEEGLLKARGAGARPPAVPRLRLAAGQ